MKNYLFTRNYIKQIFADDPTEPTKEQQSTEQSTESQGGKTKEADPPKPDDKGGEKKYTDADIDKIVNTRLARERENIRKMLMRLKNWVRWERRSAQSMREISSKKSLMPSRKKLRVMVWQRKLVRCLQPRISQFLTLLLVC